MDSWVVGVDWQAATLTAVRVDGVRRAPAHRRARRLRDGKSRREAVRALKRHLARRIFRTIKQDLASGITCFAVT